MKQLIRNVKIIGTGSYVPEIVYTNEYLETILPTSSQWIYENLGIKERRIATKNEATSDLAWKAGINAIENAGLTKDDIDLLFIATATRNSGFKAPFTLAEGLHRTLHYELIRKRMKLFLSQNKKYNALPVLITQNIPTLRLVLKNRISKKWLFVPLITKSVLLCLQMLKHISTYLIQIIRWIIKLWQCQHLLLVQFRLTKLTILLISRISSRSYLVHLQKKILKKQSV